ncbi:MAG: L,D-transpeptidase family protein [Pseudomonadota bacterium]
MTRGAATTLAAVAALATAPFAHAAAPSLAVAADRTAGLAPLPVTFTAQTDATIVRWDFGDGTTAEGTTVRHDYATAGVYRALATAVSATGEESRAEAVVTAYRIAFDAPVRGRYGGRGRFTGSIWPAIARAAVEIRGPRSAVARGRTGEGGGFVLRGRLLSRGPFRARVAGYDSQPDATALVPAVEARVVGSGVVGEPLRLVARVRPAAAGRLVVRVTRGGRRVAGGTYAGAAAVRLPSGAPALLSVRVAVEPADGYLAARPKTLSAVVARPDLALGSRGAGVLALERRLAELHYALPAADGTFGFETLQAVLAFQAVERLPQTGRLDERTWRRLVGARAPMPRQRGSHIEVSKGGQYLMAVRDSRVTAVVHVSTGATGNTPLGSFHIYRKIVGWDWVLWYPMYFLRGFAIHGYPSVPAYPASHGCVRVPMWIAPRLFAQFAEGQTVVIYW